MVQRLNFVIGTGGALTRHALLRQYRVEGDYHYVGLKDEEKYVSTELLITGPTRHYSMTNFIYEANGMRSYRDTNTMARLAHTRGSPKDIERYYYVWGFVRADNKRTLIVAVDRQPGAEYLLRVHSSESSVIRSSFRCPKPAADLTHMLKEARIKIEEN